MLKTLIYPQITNQFFSFYHVKKLSICKDFISNYLSAKTETFLKYKFYNNNCHHIKSLKNTIVINECFRNN